MAEYQKSQQMSGEWVKAADLKNGSKAKLVSEVHPVASQFKNEKTGEPKMQDVGKLLVQGWKEPKNVSLNRTTINGLVDAFGTNSAAWVNNVLTVVTMKALVSGKMATILYLVPDGYELGEQDGFPFISKVGTGTSEATVNVDDGEVSEDDLPF